MITWRGIVERVAQRPLRYGFAFIVIYTTFEVYDDSAPTVMLHVSTEEWGWPLSAFNGMGPAQIANMVINTGLEHLPPSGVPPGTPSTFDPPSLKSRGAIVLMEYRQGGRVLDLPLPKRFGP